MKVQQTCKSILFLALPVVISKLSFTIMGLVDIAMVGTLGPLEQAGVGIATSLIITVYLLGFGVISSVNTFVSQYRGAGDRDMCGRVLGSSLRLSFIIGILNMALLMLSRPLFESVGLSEKVAEAAYGYIFFRSMGAPVVFLFYAYNSFVEGTGKTYISMRVSIGANVVNILLDKVFIFGWWFIPALGVEGAGIATALSNTFMLFALAFVVHWPGSDFKNFGTGKIASPVRRELVKGLLKTGLPMGFQFFLEHGAFFLMNIIIGWVSDEALAANQVALRIMSISFMTTWGMSIATTTLVGAHQGADNAGGAHETVVKTLYMAAAAASVFGVVFFVIPEFLAGLFTGSPGVIGLAVDLMYIAAVIQFFDGLSLVAYGALRGAGDTAWPFKAAVFLNWFVGLPVVYLLTIPAGLGVKGAWLGILIQVFLQSIAMLFRFFQGKWKSIRLLACEAA